MIFRIPMSAITVKSVQYYVEGKHYKGNVVKSFGSPSDPNVVMIDPKAAPQMMASASDDKPEKAEGAVREDLDDEAAPITGELEEKQNRSRKRSSGSSGPGRIGAMGYAGI